MSTPEAKEDSSSAHVQEGFLGVKKGGGPIRIADLHPQASGVGPISAKRCWHILGRVHGPIRCEERNKINGQR